MEFEYNGWKIIYETDGENKGGIALKKRQRIEFDEFYWADGKQVCKNIVPARKKKLLFVAHNISPYGLFNAMFFTLGKERMNVVMRLASGFVLSTQEGLLLQKTLKLRLYLGIGSIQASFMLVKKREYYFSKEGLIKADNSRYVGSWAYCKMYKIYALDVDEQWFLLRPNEPAVLKPVHYFVNIAGELDDTQILHIKSVPALLEAELPAKIVTPILPAFTQPSYQPECGPLIGDIELV